MIIMMREKLVASDFLAKDVLNLENGDLMGSVTGLLVSDAPLRVMALAFYNEDVKQMAFCDYALVTDVDQQVVVVSSCPEYLPSGEKTLIGLSCVDCNGKVVGQVVDCVWQSVNGTVSEVIVAQEHLQAVVPASAIEKLGSGAMVLNVPDDQLEKEVSGGADNRAKMIDADAEELLHGLIRRVGATLSEAGQRVGERVKQIDTDEINREVNRFTERVGKELRNVIETISEQTKTPKNATMESEISSVMRDLEDFTVSGIIYDRDGNIIVMPRQVITPDIVKRIIENGKIAELYRVAVSIQDGENDE